ncbi:MAG: amino acid permease [Candidatus Omnitrophota bacterium]|jgi:amino acid transporter|nr:MAG: amino acid permease [Candidatus Omnitrophota bacterium]
MAAMDNASPKKELTLFDSTCLIVGIIIGAGIYQTAPDIAKGVSHAWGVMAIWIAGGVLSLCGALGYAELASAYPREGGDYVYLSRAYGRWAGFLFGWIQLVIVRPGDIAIMAFAFATYARTLFDPFSSSEISYTQILYASLAAIVFTGINMIGVKEGKWTQNLLTSAKALGLLAIVGVAILSPRAVPLENASFDFPLSVSLILVLFTYGGWNEMAYVAAEVKNPQKNIVRALVLGTVSVTALYLLANGAFLYTLGYSGMVNSEAVATDTVATVFPHWGSRIISVLICISALGAVNGLVFTGARITYAVGSEHRALSLLGKWNEKTGTPLRALFVQGLIAVTLIILLGSFMRTILYYAASVYLFYLATTISVMVLRWKEPHIPRPYKVTGYPFTTLLFAGTCIFLIYKALLYDVQGAITSMGIVLLGLPVYWITSKTPLK